MTLNEKKKIYELRAQGKSYKEIAVEVGMSTSSVSSFLLRNPEGIFKDYCKDCGKELTHVKGKKKKIFCSDECRTHWWTTHKNLINRKTLIEKQCKCCNKNFTSYLTDNKKYCCHECYIKDRYYAEVNTDESK